MTNPELQAIKNRFGIIGNAPGLNHAINVSVQVATTDLTVLITGESGSGKESFSKIIHNLSARKHGPFIAINCGAIPEGTIDSELFGHEKGSFTGALDARKGYFETTNGGTIFLDEIGEMPIGTQARLLRVLENGEFIRVGSSKVQKTDVRVVAATNVNLLEAVGKGKFREDLYYRLNTVPVFVPPLRERGEDIYMLFRKFTNDFSERYRSRPARLTPEAKAVLVDFEFPGNIRQLKNIAEQITILETHNEAGITAEVLSKYLYPTPPPSRKATLPMVTEESTTSFSERELLYKVLFDMRRDVNELKKLVLDLLKTGGLEAGYIDTHKELFQTVSETDLTVAKLSPETPRMLVAPQHLVELDRYPAHRPEVEDVVHVSEDESESLSLEEKEKEMIRKALLKNNQKRKYAALALGISERTLYRKIKQYGLEE
jgi:transcriptional regulator with PAS, ATPase and Fis domain